MESFKSVRTTSLPSLLRPRNEDGNLIDAAGEREDDKENPSPPVKVEHPEGLYIHEVKKPDTDACNSAFLAGDMSSKMYERCQFQTAGWKSLGLEFEGGIFSTHSLFLKARDGVDLRLTEPANPTFDISLTNGPGYMAIAGSRLQIDAGLKIGTNPDLATGKQVRTHLRGKLLHDLADRAFLTLAVRAFDMDQRPSSLQTEIIGGGLGVYGQLRGGILGAPEEIEKQITGQLTDASYLLLGAETNVGLFTNYSEAMAELIAPTEDRSEFAADASWMVRGEGIEDLGFLSLVYAASFKHHPFKREAYASAEVALEISMIPGIQFFLKGHAGHLFPIGSDADPLYPDYQTDWYGGLGVRVNYMIFDDATTE